MKDLKNSLTDISHNKSNGCYGIFAKKRDTIKVSLFATEHLE